MALVPKKLSQRALLGGGIAGRNKRYILTFLGCSMVIWALCGSYLLLVPRSYTGSFVLLLPGTGAGSSVNLESIGQASTAASSPFSSPDMSPTQNYRRLLISHAVLAKAAQLAGEPEATFPTPQVELADQTKVIGVTVHGRSPGRAEARADALHHAFLDTLDRLREGEIQTRDETSREMVKGYRTSLDQARLRLIQQQAQTGLVSLDQFHDTVALVDRLRQQLHEQDTKLAQLRSATAELGRLLDTTPEAANTALVLSSDPLFQGLFAQLAKDDAELTTLGGTRAAGNPRMQELQAERGNIVSRLSARASDLTDKRHPDVLHFRDISIRDERARLFERLVSDVVEESGLLASEREQRSQIETEQARVLQLASTASRLDDLRSDVQVAEAVFSSALARIQISKADMFASYPLAQTLEPPEASNRPSSPKPLLAIGGGIAGEFFLLSAMVLTWLRTALLRKILKNDLSITGSPDPGSGTPWAGSTSPARLSG